jgi:hypothetical protein
MFDSNTGTHNMSNEGQRRDKLSKKINESISSSENDAQLELGSLPSHVTHIPLLNCPIPCFI